MEYLGAFFLCLGIVLTFTRKKRIFDRTNQFGVERFPSYRAKLWERMKDGLLRGFSFAMLTGGFLILGFYFENSWGWLITLPFYAFFIFILLGT